MGRLSNKAIIVTGASTGLGEAMARAICAAGARVVLTARGAEKGEAVAAELCSRGGQALFITHDVTSEASWRRMLEHAEAAHGAPDGLVNNAGGGIGRPLGELTLAEFRSVHQLNLHGTFLGMKLGSQVMQAKGGVMINLGSVGSFTGFPGGAAYCASKGGVLGLSRATAGRARPNNIRVHTLLPGRFMTEIMRKGAPPEVRQAQMAAHPMRRFGDPAELGEPVIFLLSDEAAGLDGVEWVLDGGQALG